MLGVVKVRVLGNSVIITLPKAILKATTIRDGDLVGLDVNGPDQITITRSATPTWPHPQK